MMKHGRWLWGLVALVLGCSNTPSDGGGPGESCTARRDCKSGLACVALVCVDTSARDAGALPMARGTVGETCRARNDCEAGLACVNGSCVLGTIGVPVTGKACVRVECDTKDDCCSGFLPSPNCPTYQQDCTTDPASCATYRSLCQCNRTCTDNRCIDTPPSCQSNEECSSLVTPFCVEGTCSECAEPGDCTGQSDQCLHGKCQAPCTRDEQCQLLEACQNGACVKVGCQTDRECYFMLKDPRATCESGECTVPCSIDSDCAETVNAPSFEVCEQSRCVFVGCDTDAECRAYLDVSLDPSGTRAECRAEGTTAGDGGVAAP